MNGLVVPAVLAALLFVWADIAPADNPAECEALVQKAVAMCKEKGVKATLVALDNPTGPFVRGEFYVFAVSLSMNIMTAHPHDKSLKGIPMGNIIDKKGVKFFEKFKETVENSGAGWVEYTWANPGEADVKRKRSFLMRVPDEDLYVGAGYNVK